MFGIGFTEILIVGIIALIFVGPRRLPELAQQMGRFFIKIRRVSNEVKSEIDGAMRRVEEEMDLEESKKMLAKLKSANIKDWVEDQGVEPNQVPPEASQGEHQDPPPNPQHDNHDEADDSKP